MYKKIPTVSSRFNPMMAVSLALMVLAIAASYAMRVSI